MNTVLQNRATLLIDDQGKVLFCNDNAGLLLREKNEDLTGRPLSDLFDCDVRLRGAEERKAFWQSLAESAVHVPVLLRLKRGGGVYLGLDSAGSGWFVYLGIESAGTSQEPGIESCAQFLGTSPILGIFDLNFATKQFSFSNGWKAMLGYEPHELRVNLDTWKSLLHPEDTASAPDNLGRRVRAGCSPFVVEFRMRHRDGHYIWMACAGSRQVDENLQLVRVSGVQIDITERKELEDEAVEGEERMNILSRLKGFSAFDLDYRRNRFWFSENWMRMLGENRESIFENDDAFWGVIAADLGGARDLAHVFGRTAGVGAMDVDIQLPGDNKLSAKLHYHLDVSRNGTIQRLTGCLLENGSPVLKTDGFDHVLDSITEGVILTDVGGRIVYLNAKAVSLIGCAREDALNESLTDVVTLVNPSTGAWDNEVLYRVVAGGDGNHFHSQHQLRIHGGEKQVPIIWRVAQIYDELGHTTGLALMLRNPDEMAMSPDELIRSNRMESLGILAGGIAHDFNNLLTTILGSISLAKEERDYDKLSDAEQACLTAKTLTRQLLTFARGGNSSSHQIVDGMDLLQTAVRIAAAGCMVPCLVNNSDVPCPVDVDKGQILQVFQNLIVNAIQAIPEPEAGRIDLSVELVNLSKEQVAGLPAGDYVRFIVQDNGYGIPEDIQPLIFDPFFTTKKTGTGLGLASVNSIVHNHGGSLQLISQVGVGSIFKIYLPKAKQQANPEVRPRPSLRYGTGRILFMDDDPKICELTGGMLASLDYTYDVVKSGEEALQLYRRYLNIGRPYDVVILDLTVIGGMGGESCFHKLKEMDPNVCAVVSSGYDNDEMMARFLDMGFAGYLTKPYRLKDLSNMLKKVRAG